MTHRITDSSEAFWSREDRWAVSNVQTYAPKPHFNWRLAVSLLGLIAFWIVAGIVLPATF